MIEILRSAVGGFLMGSADLVPGVSGGTIALVIGIYERLIASVREGSAALGSLLKGDLERLRLHWGRVEWMFLLPLLFGILVAVLTLSRVLEHQLETNAEVMAGAFFGLVVGSVLIAWRLIEEPRTLNYLVAVVVGVGLFVLLGLGDDVVLADPGLLVYFGSGALAICAMILPGISGSLILVLIGMYTSVLGAVNTRDVLSLGVFVAGAIVGLAIFSQLLHWALQRHHDLVLASLVGLMAGSLRVLWPWPGGVESSALGVPHGGVFAVAVAAVVGLSFVHLIARMARSQETVNEPQPTV